MPVRDLRSLSTWMKVALVFFSLGTLLFVIGFATNSWMVGYRSRGWDHRGLWRVKDCGAYRSCRSYEYVHPADYIRATQAMECIGLAAMLIAFLVFLLYVCVDSCRRRDAMLAVILFTFGAVVAMVIGYIIFAVKLEDHGYEVGWSMGVAIAGTVCIFVAGIMCVLHHQGK